MTDRDDRLRALQAQEEELDNLRAMLKPEHWPRIYDLLKRIREQIKKTESSENSDSDGPAA